MGCDGVVGGLEKGKSDAANTGSGGSGGGGAGDAGQGGAGGNSIPPGDAGIPDAGQGSNPALHPDADPMTHVNFFASASMQGRNSPSLNLDSAGDYVKNIVAQHGFVGGNPGDSRGDFFQTFDFMSFSGEGFSEEDQLHTHTFGHGLFAYGAYVASSYPSDTQAAIAQHVPGFDGNGSALLGQQGFQYSGTVSNVLAKCVGAQKPNEFIVLMAHLDHVGANSSGVFHGADDNASGSGTLLSMAPILGQMCRDHQLARSVILMWTAAEEKGLVGAKYFIDHLPAGITVANLKGVINMDMVGRWQASRISVLDTMPDGQPNFFRALLNEANASSGTPFSTINRDVGTYRDRQDGYAFDAKQVPVLMVFEGLSNATGGGSLIPEYHKITDTPDRIMSDNGGKKMKDLRDVISLVAKAAANQP